ncbi:MAG TPA: hypothetical protein VFL78_10215 [Rhodanobacteraceae bacterium]|nr:hypothetical protein [Rhodanobacteraceae bacterium]
MNVVPTTHRASKLAIHFGADASQRVRTMLHRQNLGNQAISQRGLPSGAIGCLGHAEMPEQDNLLFFTGLPIHGPDIRQVADADTAARRLPDHDGAFAGVFWDEQRGILTVVTDCLGMQPLYMRHAEGELTLVSTTAAMHGDPDLAAWGAFISIGHPIGERSLMDGLQRVPPASILTWDSAQRRLEIRRYWHWPEPSGAWRDHDFLNALEQDVRAYAALGHHGTLLLSGGFDSRLLLFLLKRAGIPTEALIVAHADEYDDADGRLAEAVATGSNMRHRKVHPPADFFSSPAYLDYLRASDVGYPSLDLFIAKVASQIDDAAVWDGLAPGFVFMPLHQHEGGFDAYRQHEVRGRDSAIWRAARTLFKPEIAEAMFEGFSDDFRTETSRLPQDMHGLARFVIENRSRNRASMNPLKVYASRTDAYTPGLSKDFMNHAATIPFAEKRNGRFYRSLFARLDRQALATPFLSGGELMRGSSAGSTYWRERARAQFNAQRARHPRLFPGSPPPRAAHSAFLGAHLLEPDPWLNPRLRDALKDVNADNYLAWKLLFHWKAWQWLHRGRFERLAGGHAS